MATLIEKVNLDRVNYLIDTHTLKDFKANCPADMSDADCKKEYNKTMKYLHIKGAGQEESKYDFLRGRKDGRMFGDNSIQNVRGTARGFLCEGISTDVDQCNAHPIVLKNICDKHDILCPCLHQYINDREPILAKIMQDDTIDRGEAKCLMLKAMNSSHKKPSNNPFFLAFHKEMKSIQSKLLLIDEYTYLHKFAKKEKGNMAGSFLNHCLCVGENIILQLMKDCFEKNGYETQALMFDGIMIYGDVSEGFLQTVENYIADNCEYTGIKLAIKEHSNFFKLPADYKPRFKQSYKQVKDEFEKYNAKVATQFVYDKYDVNIYSQTEFQVLNRSKKYYDFKKHEDKPFINEWLDDDEKREYEKFDSYPKDCLIPRDPATNAPINIYNLFKEFPVVKVPELTPKEKHTKALSYFINHIKVLTNHEDKVFDFVMMWIAQMFQYPEHKSIELIFISAEGAGKGMLLEFFKTIMGSKKVWECVDPLRDIFGSFNDNMKDSMLVCFNEANKSSFFNCNDKKKSLITEPIISINQKGKPMMTIPSYHRFITFTNNACPAVPNKRRDCIIRSSDEKIGDQDYFNEGFQYAHDIECCKFIYNYFMLFITKPKINSIDIPITEHHQIMIEEHKNPMRGWLEQQAQRWNDDGVEDLKTTPDDLFYLYKQYCDDEGVEAKKKRSFATSLSFEKLDLKSEKQWDADMKKSVRKYDINVADLMVKLKLN